MSEDSKTPNADTLHPGLQQRRVSNSPRPVPLYEPQMPAFPTSEPWPERPRAGGPLLSIVVVVFDMAEQALNTVRSLSSDYQMGVEASDYEVIVVENSSSRPMDESRLLSLGSNIRYFYRDESQPTPVHAVNFGVAQARGEWVSLMIDGARMVTPGVVNYTLAAMRLSPNAVIAVPSYHLGSQVQQDARESGYDRDAERALLNGVSWPEDGYRLFEIGVFSVTNAAGFLKPAAESNCLTCRRDVYDELGGCDTRFDTPGGGQVNLDLYKRLVERSAALLIVLAGEGSFHQLHGGATTELDKQARRDQLEQHYNRYASIRGEPYSAPQRRALYFGSFPDSAMKMVQHSAMVVRRNSGDLASYSPAQVFGPT